MDLHLILTDACNLACPYCYQNGRTGRARMSLETADAAIARVSSLGPPPHSVVLSGGEPFLARDVLTRVVRRLGREGEAGREVDVVVLSNGTLVTDDDLDLLASTGAELQLSFDGAGPAQDRRSPGSSPLLEAVADRAFERHPSWARRRLSIQMMVQGTTVGALSDSVRSLLERGVSHIRIEPLATHDPAWTRATRDALGRQVDELLAHSLVRWDRAGDVPVTFLRRTARRQGRSVTYEDSPFVCRAPSGRSVAVDPGGRAWACPAFVPTLQRLPPLAAEAAAALHLGAVGGQGLEWRLADLPRRAGCAPVLRTSPRRRSARGPCSGCPDVGECRICPASTCFVPPGLDPHRVPESQCDFQRVTLDARRRFQDHVAGPSLLREMKGRARALQRLARSLEGSAVSPGGPGAA